MATREELLIIARLEDRVKRPAAEVKAEIHGLVDEIQRADKAGADQVRTLRRLGTEYKAAERDAEKLRRKNRDLAQSWSNFGQTMTTHVTLPIVLGYGLATRAAINLQESVTATDAVFGQNADRIQAWSRTSDTAFGLSRRAALENAVQLGNMFTQMELGLDQATSMSQALIQLAADVASFRNVQGGANTVLETFQAAFRGEFDSVQRYIPQITAAAVQQQAMAMGLASGTGELSNQARAMATYQLLLTGTGAAAGDFARTQDNAANQLRVAQAALENASAELGENLLPLVARGAQLVVSITAAFADLPEPVQSAILVLGGIAAVAGPLIYVGSKVVLLRMQMQAATAAGNTWASSMSANAGRVGAVLGGLTLGLGLASTINANAKGNAAAAIAGLAPIDETDVTRVRTRYNQLIGEYSRLQRVAGQGNGVGGFFHEFAQNISPFHSNTIRDAEEATHSYATEIDRLRGIYDDLASSTSSSGRQIVAGFEDFGAAAAGAGSDLDSLTTAADAFRDRWDALFGGQLQLDAAQRQIQQFVEQAFTLLNDPTKTPTAGDRQDLALEFFRSVLPDLLAAEVAAGNIADDQVSINAAAQDYISRVLDLVPGLNAEFGTYVGLLGEANTEYQRQRDLLDEIIGRTNALSQTNPAAAILNPFGTPIQPSSGADALRGIWGLPVGDSAHPAAMARTGGSTLDAWRDIDSALGGSRRITSHVRNWGLGSPGSDHLTGRAIDVVGSNLAAARHLVRRLGGYAEFHGQGSSRHLHVVPAPRPATAPSPAARRYDLTVQSGPGLADVERAVRRGIRQADHDSRDLAERR